MGKITGFLEFDRKVEQYASVEERLKNYKEFTLPMEQKELKKQYYIPLIIFQNLLVVYVLHLVRKHVYLA